jgi:hypothetical protein
VIAGLTALFLQILKALWAMPSKRFWLIWFNITIAAVIYVMSVVGQVATPRRQKTRKRPISLILIWRQVGTPRAFVALMLLAVFLASYIAMILVWEDFAFYDDDQLMLYTLKDYNYPLAIWRHNGRFFPFSMQEFNLIRHFTNTPIGYHLLPIFQLLFLFCILLILDAELSITARAGLAILALLTPSIFLSFSGFIYEERNILFLLACLMLFVNQFERTKATAWAVAAVACAQIMIYYKEIGFLLLLGFAAGRLILRCRNRQHARWDYAGLWDQESRLDLCLASLAVLFLLSYFAVMGIHGNMNYATKFGHPMAEVVLDYLWLDLLVWLFLAVVLSRIYLILRNRTAPWLLWDGLAFGGMAYFLAYLYLGMFQAYYLAPVDLIAVLYVGRFVLLSWKHTQSWSKLAAVMLAFAVVLQDVSLSAFAAFERKNDIHAKVAIASVIEARYQSGMGKIPALFFPFAKPYPIMEFTVYLNYRGVPINSVALTKGGIAKDDRCVEYRSIRCHPASEPAPGDLVVVLPDDEASLADALVYRKRGQLLFSYEPRPPIPHWLYPFVGSFVLASDIYNQMRPDHWMDASVTVWK